ncbi:GxxExxY protein [Saccharicrinis carchari]|uniref:GxxExxY protein n=1 Tax=Saccharicrinis carchari TaxID=1168039 RepID=A0A521AL85_SACCC|nr:GxxExxY protein [Saccharicrinis carchari]SMO35576.1 GxxExxY protein [Saccharicrinis carchari]
MPNLLKQQELIYKDEAYKIIGACMTVHRELGCGFLEAVYAEALEIELGNQGIPFIREVPITIEYKGKLLKKCYLADFICYDKIILELKAINYLESVHESQVINYLKATTHKLGILVNFGEQSLKYKRIVKEK